MTSAAATAKDLPIQANKQDEPSSRSKVWFITTLAVAIVWLSGFTFLVYTTANPITLNWQQLQRSQTVVVGEVLDREAGLVKVAQHWKDTPELNSDEVVTVINLELTKVEQNESYLIPLILAEAGLKGGAASYEIPLTVDQDIQFKTEQVTQIPLVYPATDDAKKQLETLLKRAEP